MRKNPLFYPNIGLRATGYLIVLGVFTLGVVGWVRNIIALMSVDMPLAEAGVRLVGIPVALLGAVLGWI